MNLSNANSDSTIELYRKYSLHCLWRTAVDEVKRIEQEKAALNADNESIPGDDDGGEVSNYDLIMPIVLEMVDKVVESKSVVPKRWDKYFNLRIFGS